LYFELPCPHDAVHTMPAAVAGIIETLAAMRFKLEDGTSFAARSRYTHVFARAPVCGSWHRRKARASRRDLSRDGGGSYARANAEQSMIIITGSVVERGSIHGSASR
jgi:hypothetical protein